MNGAHVGPYHRKEVAGSHAPAPAEPSFDVAHLGHVELLTPKLERSVWYFQEVLGMQVVHEHAGSVYLRGYGDHATSSLKLSAAPAAGLGHLAWRASSPAALARRAEAIEGAGLGTGWSDGDFGHGRCYRFRDPDGHPMEVYYDETPYRAPPHLRSALKNQPMRYPGRGVGVRKTDHVALLCRDVVANRHFAQSLLGLRLREQVVFENGRREIGAWMSANAVHHELAYVVDRRQASGRLHHYSLFVDDKCDVLRAADILREHEVFIETGPSKHNNSQAFYIYSYEPGGNRVEIYSSGFFVLAPDFEPVVWDEHSRGTGVYWGAALPDSFLEYATPDVSASASGEASSKAVVDVL